MPKPVQASTYTFRHIIEGGFLYVDKTRCLYELARPRRFGKSLMISMLEEIFRGNKALFNATQLPGTYRSFCGTKRDFCRSAT